MGIASSVAWTTATSRSALARVLDPDSPCGVGERTAAEANVPAGIDRVVRAPAAPRIGAARSTDQPFTRTRGVEAPGRVGIEVAVGLLGSS